MIAVFCQDNSIRARTLLSVVKVTAHDDKNWFISYSVPVYNTSRVATNTWKTWKTALLGKISGKPGKWHFFQGKER